MVNRERKSKTIETYWSNWLLSIVEIQPTKHLILIISFPHLIGIIMRLIILWVLLLSFRYWLQGNPFIPSKVLFHRKMKRKEMREEEEEDWKGSIFVAAKQSEEKLSSSFSICWDKSLSFLFINFMFPWLKTFRQSDQLFNLKMKYCFVI